MKFTIKRIELFLVLVLGLSFALVGGDALFSVVLGEGSDEMSVKSLPEKTKPPLNLEKQKKYSTSQSGGEEKISEELLNLISSATTEENLESGRQALATASPALKKAKLLVIFETGGFDIEPNYLKSYGGNVVVERKTLIAEEVPIAEIKNIVSNNERIEYARLPMKAIPLGVTSEGVDLVRADRLHEKGIMGANVKVAVIDVGFKGLSAAQLNGDMPYDIRTKDYTGTGLQTQFKHGTACAEIVHDVAPDAKLYLLKVIDEVDLYRATAYCINRGIDIISASLGFFGTGPGDGTGAIADRCDELKENGILVITAAGNAAKFTSDGVRLGSHWQGNFRDSNNDGSHEFIRNKPGSWYNVIGAFPGQDDDGNPLQGDVVIYMRWDDWPNASVDYDIFLYDYNTDDLVGSSTNRQNGSQTPLEYIIIDIPDNEDYTHYYYLEVWKRNGEPAGVDIELLVVGTGAFVPFENHTSPIATSSRSILEPADAESVLAVAAINHSKWTTGPQEGFSSRGPTNAWAGSRERVKPDISGPDGVSGFSYGADQFLGTSAATPHVAGVAALILSKQPHLTPDELRSVIESNAVDMGDRGKDNIYGWGRLRAPNYSVPSDPTNLSSFILSGGKIQLRWKDNSNNEQGFKIERKVGNGDFARIATVSANTNTYNNGGLIASETYTYRVRAYNGEGNSDYSNEVIVSPSQRPVIKNRKPSSGKRNKKITIKGNNFGAKNSKSKVLFYSSKRRKYAKIVFWRNRTIKCRVPRMPKGKCKIKVYNSKGKSSAKSFRVK